MPLTIPGYLYFLLLFFVKLFIRQFLLDSFQNVTSNPEIDENVTFIRVFPILVLDLAELDELD